MICPNCNAEMEAGEVGLKVRGSIQAELSFNNEVLWIDMAVLGILEVFTAASKVQGYRCQACRTLVFQYPKDKVSPMHARDLA